MCHKDQKLVLSPITIPMDPEVSNPDRIKALPWCMKCPCNSALGHHMTISKPQVTSDDMTWWYLEHCFTLNLTATKSALQEVLSAASAAFLDYRPLRTMASDWWQQYFGPCRRTSNRFTQADHLHVLRIDHINHIGVAETGWLEKKAGLVGGLEHFYFSIYWECHHPNWLYLCNIFQGGRSTTNQRTSSIFFCPGRNSVENDPCFAKHFPMPRSTKPVGPPTAQSQRLIITVHPPFQVRGQDQFTLW